jgi:hypothetical protein
VEDEEQPKLSLGLFARQFRAFDRDGLTAEFDVPDHWQITTMSPSGAYLMPPAPQGQQRQNPQAVRAVVVRCQNSAGRLARSADTAHAA